MDNELLSRRSSRESVEPSKDWLTCLRVELTKLGLILGVEVSQGRILSYQDPLFELSSSQVKLACDTAAKEYKPYGGSFPSPAELIAFVASAGAALAAKLDKENTAAILKRDLKPGDWSRLDSVWDLLERRMDTQERLDLAYVEPFSDEDIEAAMKLGKPYPGKDLYTDWVRRKEARARLKSGAKRKPARSQLAGFKPLVERFEAAALREPGEEG